MTDVTPVQCPTLINSLCEHSAGQSILTPLKCVTNRALAGAVVVTVVQQLPPRRRPRRRRWPHLLFCLLEAL